MPCHQPFRDDSAQLLLYKIAGCLAGGGFTAGVSSFNGLAGPVTFTGADIITLLGCTPACEGNVVNSFNGQTGAVTLTLADVSAVADARYVLKTGDTMTGALAIGNGSLVANAPVLSLSQTWNNAAVAFTGSLVNVTNTAAAAASPLFDVQKNAATVFNLRTDGRLVLLGRASFTTTSSIGHGFFVSDALTTAAPLVGSFTHTLSAGVGAVGIGVSVDFSADTATVITQRQLRISSTWTDATQATRTSQVNFILPNSGVDTATLILGSNQVQVRDGTVALPGLTFQGDTDVGLYRIGANNLGITVGGGLVLSASATTGIIVSTSLSLPYVAKVALYTASAVDYTIDCTANTFTVSLPTAVGITGRIYVVKNSGVGTITIDPSGAELIDSLATATIVSGASITTQSTGTGWIII